MAFYFWFWLPLVHRQCREMQFIFLCWSCPVILLESLIIPGACCRFLRILYIDSHAFCREREFCFFLFKQYFLNLNFLTLFYWQERPVLCEIRLGGGGNLALFCILQGKHSILYHKAGYSIFVDAVYEVAVYREFFYHECLLNFIECFFGASADTT